MTPDTTGWVQFKAGWLQDSLPPLALCKCLQDAWLSELSIQKEGM